MTRAIILTPPTFKAIDHGRLALLHARDGDRFGYRLALAHLSRAYTLARKDMDRAAMRSIARMRNWLRADLRKVEVA
jgi:hypothetical protein